MIPSLEGLPTKAKEAPSPHEVRLAPVDTNPVFQILFKSLMYQQRHNNDDRSMLFQQSQGL